MVAIVREVHRGDVFCEGDAVVDWLDVHDIDTDDGGGAGHLLGAHLHPATGGSAQVDNSFCIFEELVHEDEALHNIALGKQKGLVLAIQLDELVGRARSKALLLGEVVVLVQAALACFRVLHHE